MQASDFPPPCFGMITKTILLLSAVLIFLQAGNERTDNKSSVKLSSWTFYFAKVPFMSGGENETPSPRELSVKPDRELMIALTYEGQPPSMSTLSVRTSQGVQREYQHQNQEAPDAFTPTVNQGTQFVIPVSDIIGSSDVADGEVQTEFFYSDGTGVSELKLGTLVLKW